MASMVSTNGMTYLEMDTIGVPVTPETTNKFKPIGGVIKPIPKEVIMNIQKWISFIPIFWASGSSNGAIITIFGVVSITQPAIIKITTMMRMIKYGLLVREVMKLTNA